MADPLVGEVDQIHQDLERHKNKRVSFQGPGLPDLSTLDNGRLGYSPDSKIDESDRVSSIIPVPHLGLVTELREHLGLPEQREITISGSIREKMIREKLEQRWHSEAVAILPVSAFERIFTSTIVKSVLKETYPRQSDEELNSLLHKILGPDRKRERRRILAVLIFMKEIYHLGYFIGKEIYDQDLPINFPTDEEYRDVERKHFSPWDENEKILFTSYQKMIFVPVLHLQSDELFSYGFNEHARLPWLSYELKSKGGFGVVFKVQIHPSHSSPMGIKADEGAGQYFALKKIGSKNSKHYRDELAALEKSSIQAGREKHLIKLLLTYTHGKKNYFLFEWADMNLFQYWRKNAPNPSPEGIEWVAHQCLGIAKAIRRIHGLTTMQKTHRKSLADDSSDEDRDSGRHGDIKPENILWFSKYGEERNILVVSDLGLTRYHTRQSVSHVRNSQIEGFSWTYRAPESDLGKETSQKYDVWSLGCVFLEFWIWQFGGHTAQTDFEGDRMDEDDSDILGLQSDKFYSILGNSNEAVVKPSVGKWIAWLYSRDECTAFIKRVLDIIGNGMLVVDVKARWKIDQVYTEIFHAVQLLSEVPSCIDQPSTADNISLFPEATQMPEGMVEPKITVGQIVRDAEGDSFLRPPEDDRSRQSSISLGSRVDPVEISTDSKEPQTEPPSAGKLPDLGCHTCIEKAQECDKNRDRGPRRWI
ncbi:hypothetical protein PG995_012314, partial [Apiospora arundinis]